MNTLENSLSKKDAQNASSRMGRAFILYQLILPGLVSFP
jgi:hypothetical protein